MRARVCGRTRMQKSTIGQDMLAGPGLSQGMNNCEQIPEQIAHPSCVCVLWRARGGDSGCQGPRPTWQGRTGAQSRVEGFEIRRLVGWRLYSALDSELYWDRKLSRICGMTKATTSQEMPGKSLAEDWPSRTGSVLHSGKLARWRYVGCGQLRHTSKQAGNWQVILESKHRSDMFCSRLFIKALVLVGQDWAGTRAVSTSADDRQVAHPLKT